MVEIIILLIVLLAVISLTYIEAILWHLEGYKIGNINKHIPLVIVRCTVCLLGLFVSIYYTVGIGLLVIGIHPSILYYFRNKFNPDVYVNTWLAEPSKGKKSSTINFKLWHRIVLVILSIVLFSISSIAQDSTDFSKMNRSQIRQYRLLIESGYKKQLNQERQYYAYKINESKRELLLLKEYNNFKLDSMLKYRKLERLNYNKSIQQLKVENRKIKDSLKVTTNYYIKDKKILARLQKNNTRYLYGIITLILIITATIIYIINKLR